LDIVGSSIINDYLYATFHFNLQHLGHWHK